MARKKLGETLRDLGKISQKDLLEAIEVQAGNAGFLGELLLRRGLVSKTDLVASLEEVTKTPYVDATSVKVAPEIVQLVPLKIARRFCLLPVDVDNKKLVAVMVSPQDLLALQELAFISGMDVAPRLGLREEIEEAITKNYGTTPAEVAMADSEQRPVPKLEFNAVNTKHRNLQAILEFQADLLNRATPAVVFFSNVVSEAIVKRASDIHIDPQMDSPVVRIRVDGILRDIAKVPAPLQDSLVSRIKILADMDIAERRAPQDGRLLVTFGEEKRDLRVSTLPTQYGEKVVIRLLDGKSSLVPLQALGLWEEQADLLKNLLTRPQGMILVTGPTGSGKTTTLYSALNVLRTRNLNVITVEDPVEYQIDGVNQVQVNEKAGRTFASSLRSILRQDPNVIMVGEIRDGETAEIALRAAQTGHMVLSTMHTLDSVSAIARLTDLHIPAFMVAASVSAILAQRLVRKLCNCRTEVPATREYQEILRESGVCDSARTMFAPVGCPECDNAGYRGRVGLYEVLVFDESVAEAVRAGGSPAAIRQAAWDNGMRSLQEDGLIRAHTGVTSIEEVMRVVNFKIGSPVAVGFERRQRVDRRQEG